MQPLLLTRRPLAADAAEVVIQECLTGILARCSPRLVILFGSAARGEMTDQSDLDFMLIFDTSADCRLASRCLRQGTLLAPVPVDLICVATPDYLRKRTVGGICMIAAEDGRVLYRDPSWNEA